jgi:hypothetical protein
MRARPLLLAFLVATGPAACEVEDDDGADARTADTRGDPGDADAAAGNGAPCGIGGTGGLPDAQAKACADCGLAKCRAEYEQCYGPNWDGGDCDAFVDCTRDCDCSDSACQQACLPRMQEGNCQACALTVVGCQTTACAAECGF